MKKYFLNKEDVNSVIELIEDYDALLHQEYSDSLNCKEKNLLGKLKNILNTKYKLSFLSTGIYLFSSVMLFWLLIKVLIEIINTIFIY